MARARVNGTSSNDLLSSNASPGGIVFGLAGDDTLSGGVAFGAEGNDFISGPGYSSQAVLSGGAGNDTFSATAGDFIQGGAGDDLVRTVQSAQVIAQFSGNQADYEYDVLDPGFGSYTVIVTDTRAGSPEGTDTIDGAAVLTFADSSVSLYSTVTIPDAQQTDVYRFYNTATETHFYTTDTTEVAFIQANLPSFRFEGKAFQAASGEAVASASPIYRLYDTVTETHFYTFESSEVDALSRAAPTFRFEGVAMFGFKPGQTPPNGAEELYRFYNNATGAHFFTASEDERDFVLTSLPSYDYEGLAGWVLL